MNNESIYCRSWDYEEPMKVVENSSYVGGFGFEPIINTNLPSVGVGAPSIKSARKIWGHS